MLEEEAPALEKFILPGGTPAADHFISHEQLLDAERKTVTLMKSEEDVSDVVVRYLNRLSDYLFVAARIANSRVNVRDNEYVRSAKVFRTGDKDKKKDE